MGGANGLMETVQKRVADGAQVELQPDYIGHMLQAAVPSHIGHMTLFFDRVRGMLHKSDIHLVASGLQYVPASQSMICTADAGLHCSF